MIEERAERLRQARMSAGYVTARHAAEALGIGYSTYAAHENGNSHFRLDRAQIYAQAFNVSLEWLLTGSGPSAVSGAIPIPTKVVGLPVVGSIQAGLWIETTYAEGDDVGQILPVARDERFPRARQYALRVIGDSMNLDYPDGSYVTCVDFAETGMPIVAGMVVHVERLRAGGQLVEITLKEVATDGDVFVLRPRSTNSKWQIIRFDEPDTEVVIRGIVTGSWRQTLIPPPSPPPHLAVVRN